MAAKKQQKQQHWSFQKFLDQSPFLASYLEWLCTGPGPTVVRHDVEFTWCGKLTDDQLPVLHVLGMPADKPLIRSCAPGASYDPKFKDFFVEVFGVEGDVPPEIVAMHEADLIEQQRHFEKTGIRKTIQFDISKVPSHIPLVGQYTQTKDGKLSIQVWRIRVFLINSSIFTEEIWNGHTRSWISQIVNIPDAPNPKTTKQLQRIAEGFAFGRRVTAPKNTRGPEIDRADFLSWGVIAAAKLAESGKKLTDENLRVHYRVHRNTVAKYREEYAAEYAVIKKTYEAEVLKRAG